MIRVYSSTTLVKLKLIWPCAKRGLATSSSGAPFQVFNAETKRHQRNRAAILDPEKSRRTDYLRDEVAVRLVERFMVFIVNAKANNSLSIANSRLSWTLVQDQDI
jgi:hypothetical protein